MRFRPSSDSITTLYIVKTVKKRCSNALCRLGGLVNIKKVKVKK